MFCSWCSNLWNSDVGMGVVAWNFYYRFHSFSLGSVSVPHALDVGVVGS
jgi:hypothetical protein